MIETECQKLVVDAVKSCGGQAIKLNNRFVNGVVDLFGKLPGHEPWWLEAKLANLSPKTRDHVWDVGCTKLQKDFLRDWREAGMLTGVVSFVQDPNRGLASLEMAIYSYNDMANRGWQAERRFHRPLGEKSERFTNIMQQLIEFTNG